MLNGAAKKGNNNNGDLNIQLPALESGTMSGPLVSTTFSFRRTGGGVGGMQNWVDALHGALRVLCLLTSVIAMSLMVTAKEDSTMSIFGLELPVSAKWSFADSFEYLVGVCAAAATHSVLQLLISLMRFKNNVPVIPSRNYAWLIFAGDQIFAYAMMSAGSAAAGVTNLNRTGIRHSALPNFCQPLHMFCNRVAASIGFTLFSCFLLAASVVLDVIWLANY